MITEKVTTMTQSDITYTIRNIGNTVELISLEPTRQEGNVRVINRDLYVCRYTFIYRFTGLLLWWKKPMYNCTWEPMKNNYFDYFGTKFLRERVDNFGEALDLVNDRLAAIETWSNEISPWANKTETEWLNKQLINLREKMGIIRDDVNNMMPTRESLKNPKKEK